MKVKECPSLYNYAIMFISSRLNSIWRQAITEDNDDDDDDDDNDDYDDR